MSFAHDRAGTPASVWRAEVTRRSLLPLGLDRPAGGAGDAGAGVERIVVLAAHPDDETLGAGGLVARAHRLGLEVVVVVATRGEGSHPRSPTHDRERLAAVRTVELDEAVRALGPGVVRQLGWPDGDVAVHEEDLVADLVDLVGDGRTTWVVAPWRHDGHPDHEAVGRAAATVCARTGARLLEYPVWFWHWASPAAGDLPWHQAKLLALDPVDLARKRAAIAAHRSQVAPLSDAPGDEVLLGPDLLEHFDASSEVFWEQPPRDEALESLHRREADPWGVDHRFYEQRKRAIVTAMLPRARFRRAAELGCSSGALAADLAARCDELIAVDASPSALDAARRRLGGLPHVEVVEGRLPAAVPDGVLDLVVLSEVGYFLDHASLEELGDRVARALAPDGVVVLCHWRHPVRGWPLDGAVAHRLLQERPGMPGLVATYHDRDVEVLLLAAPETLPDPHAAGP